MTIKKPKNFIIFTVLYAAYVSIYIARLNLSMATPELKALKIMDESQIGLLGSVFSVVFASGRLINGALSDKVKPFIMITSGLCLAGLGNLFISFFPPFELILVLWGINAFAQSMLWSAVLRTVSETYEPWEAKKKTSYMVTAVASGNIIGILLSSALIKGIDVSAAFYIPAAITFLIALLVFIFISPIQCSKCRTKTHIPLYRLFSEKDIRRLLLPVMFHGVMKDNISLWMTLYFVDTYGIDLAESALFVIFIPLLGLAGRLLFPLCYKISKENEHTVSFIAYLGCIVFAVILFFASSPIPSVICLGMIYMAVSLFNTSVLSVFPLRYSESGNVASVSGLMDFSTYLGAGIGSAVYGVSIKSLGYSFMFGSWILISLISLLILFFGFIKKQKA